MTQSANDFDGGRRWKGAAWLADQLVAAGFEVPRVATGVFVADALDAGILSSRDDYDRFWAEMAEELVRNGFRSDGRIAGYRSSYIERRLAGRDLRTFVSESPGLFGWSNDPRPAEEREASRRRLLEAIEKRKAVEWARPDVVELAKKLARGPAAAMTALATELPLKPCKGRDIGLPADVPCLLAEGSGGRRPFLLWESGRNWRRVGDLSVGCGIQIDGEVRQSNPAELCRGLHWYRRVGSDEDAALGLMAYARFVVGLSKALKEQDQGGQHEAP